MHGTQENLIVFKEVRGGLGFSHNARSRTIKMVEFLLTSLSHPVRLSAAKHIDPHPVLIA